MFAGAAAAVNVKERRGPDGSFQSVREGSGSFVWVMEA
jgi:hypothetical protein